MCSNNKGANIWVLMFFQTLGIIFCLYVFQELPENTSFPNDRLTTLTKYGLGVLVVSFLLAIVHKDTLKLAAKLPFLTDRRNLKAIISVPICIIMDLIALAMLVSVTGGLLGSIFLPLYLIVVPTIASSDNRTTLKLIYLAISIVLLIICITTPIGYFVQHYMLNLRDDYVFTIKDTEWAEKRILACLVMSLTFATFSSISNRPNNG